MLPRLWVKEIKPIDVSGGYLVDGFPSVGLISAIASESLMHTADYELVGFVDSSDFPTVTILKDGIPNYATRIFVNQDIKVGIFTSYLTINEPYHRSVAKMMLGWAKKHKCKMIVSSCPMKLPDGQDQIIAAGSTNSAREKIKQAGMTVLQNGTIPGIPGALLNEGMLSGQDIIVVLVNVEETPDFKSSARLCMAMSKILPGVACDFDLMQKQAEIVEKEIKKTEKETRSIKESMYG
jgi:uncharacterized protein